MRFLITGHTGFKGAWLTLWLNHLGHEVHGLALDPDPGGLFARAQLNDVLGSDVRQDIRDAAAVASLVADVRPDVVIHLAAQPLVRQSYLDPRETMETNVFGTLNVLEAVRAQSDIRAVLIVTTDKVYRNVNQIWGYREADALGGHDPYSASKAMADLLTDSWRASFPGPPMATARAGNVIGGGDSSPDRLLPDLMRAYAAGIEPTLRYPAAVRPWQHVLDCLNGYLVLVAALLRKTGEGAWNFGPGVDSFRTVAEVSSLVAAAYGTTSEYQVEPDQPHEAQLLALDATRARLELQWHVVLGFHEAVNWSVEWTQRVASGQDARRVALEQISAFQARASPRPLLRA